jgi:hypothetical protein
MINTETFEKVELVGGPCDGKVVDCHNIEELIVEYWEEGVVFYKYEGAGKAFYAPNGG